MNAISSMKTGMVFSVLLCTGVSLAGDDIFQKVEQQLANEISKHVCFANNYSVLGSKQYVKGVELLLAIKQHNHHPSLSPIALAKNNPLAAAVLLASGLGTIGYIYQDKLAAGLQTAGAFIAPLKKTISDDSSPLFSMLAHAVEIGGGIYLLYLLSQNPWAQQSFTELLNHKNIFYGIGGVVLGVDGTRRLITEGKEFKKDLYENMAALHKAHGSSSGE